MPIFIANVSDPELAEKVKKMKVKCEAERKEGETERNAGFEVKHMLTQMMGAVKHGGNRLQNRNDWSVCGETLRLPSTPALRRL